MPSGRRFVGCVHQQGWCAHLHKKLASFAIDEQELVSARELMSGGPAQPMEDDAEAEAAEREAEAAAAAATAASEARYAELAARRESGKRKEVEKRAAKKQRVQSHDSSPDPDSDDSGS